MKLQHATRWIDNEDITVRNEVGGPTPKNLNTTLLENSQTEFSQCTIDEHPIASGQAPTHGVILSLRRRALTLFLIERFLSRNLFGNDKQSYIRARTVGLNDTAPVCLGLSR